MAATDARPVPRKNIAWRMYFAIRKSDGTLITTWAGMDSTRSLDGAAFAACTNEATEIGTSGCGYIDFTAAEMNADAVVYKLTVTNTGALPLVLVIFPEESGDYRIDATAFVAALPAGQVNINVVNQTTFQNGTLTIIRGADYLNENTNLIHFTGVANIGAATILYLTIVNNSTSAIITGISRLASTAIDAGLQTADFAIPSAIIASLADGTHYSFSVERKITVSATDYYNPILLGPTEVRANNRTFV